MKMLIVQKFYNKLSGRRTNNILENIIKNNSEETTLPGIGEKHTQRVV